MTDITIPFATKNRQVQGDIYKSEPVGIVLTDDHQAQILAPLLARVEAMERFKADSEEMTRRLKELRPDLAEKLEQIATPVDAGPAVAPPAADPAPAEDTCSFCSRTRSQVDRLIQGPVGHTICNQCVDVCHMLHHENNKPAADPAGDEAAEGILSGIISTYGVNTSAHPDSCRPHARAILAAIRRGEVPGIGDQVFSGPERDQLRAELERLTREVGDSNRSANYHGDQYARICKERDEARAEAETLRAERDTDLKVAAAAKRERDEALGQLAEAVALLRQAYDDPATDTCAVMFQVETFLARVKGV